MSEVTMTVEELLSRLGEPDYKMKRLAHGAEPFHFWSRESILQAFEESKRAAAKVLEDAKIDPETLRKPMTI